MSEPRTERARADAAEKPEWWSSDEWATPTPVADNIAKAYGPFDLDPCCRPATAKAPHFFTKVEDGLVQPWHGRVWVNPPYSEPSIWVQKAIAEVRAGRVQRVVMLLPAAVDTGWFHDYVLPNADVVFMRGRVKFIGWQGTPIGSPKAGTILAVFPKQTPTLRVRDLESSDV